MRYTIVTEHAAQIIGVTPGCLRVWRHRGIGPSYEMRGGFAYYDRREVNRFAQIPRPRGRKPGGKNRPKAEIQAAAAQ